MRMRVCKCKIMMIGRHSQERYPIINKMSFFLFSQPLFFTIPDDKLHADTHIHIFVFELKKKTSKRKRNLKRFLYFLYINGS